MKCYLNLCETQNALSAFWNQGEMVRHLHIVVSGRAPDVNVEVLHHCCHGEFDLHGCYSSSETRPSTFSKEGDLLTHGLQTVRLRSIQPALWVEAVWIREDVGIPMLRVGLA